MALYISTAEELKELGFSTSCDIQVTCDMQEYTSLLSRGAKRVRPGRYSWQMTADVMMDSSTGADIEFLSVLTGRSKITVVMQVDTPDSSRSIAGQAYVQTWRLTGAIGSMATYNVTLVGDGPLSF